MADQLLPVQCALDQKVLAEVARKVGKISDQMDALESRTGPIAAHELRLGAVEVSVDSAHRSIRDHHDEIETLKKANTAIQVRLGVVLVPAASAVGAAVGAIVAKLL